MPLRRRQPEPSPRLLALLDDARGPRARGSGGARPEASPPAEREDDVWLPTRAWLASPSAAPPAGPPPAQPPPAGQAARQRPCDDDSLLADFSVRREPGPRPGRHRRPQPRSAVLALPEALIGARLRSARGAVAGMLV